MKLSDVENAGKLSRELKGLMILRTKLAEGKADFVLGHWDGSMYMNPVRDMVWIGGVGGSARLGSLLDGLIKECTDKLRLIGVEE